MNALDVVVIVDLAKHLGHSSPLRGGSTKNPHGHDLRLLKRIFQQGWGPDLAMMLYRKIMDERMSRTLLKTPFHNQPLGGRP